MKDIFKYLTGTLISAVIFFGICYWIAPTATMKGLKVLVAFVTGLGGAGDQILQG